MIILYFISLESKIKVLADLVFGEGHFLVHRWCLFVVFSYDGRDELALWGLFCKGTYLNLEGPILMT